MKEKQPPMSTTAIPADEFRINFTDYLSRVRFGNEVIAITHYKRSAAYLISPELMQLLLDPAKRINKRQRAEAFKQMDKILSKSARPDIDPSELEATIQREVDAVRAERKAKRKP